ncbi:MAG TPA: HAMP domain-containing sensor histidine kinase [Streptosporangiaceae bacterium]|nr:HAMP domain-containing sensor histidine kinase [Streptosporangiaceae bacterium]
MGLRLPRRTVRLRLTAMYGALFLFTGALLLLIADGLFVSEQSVAAITGPGQPGLPVQQSALARAQATIQQLRAELANQGNNGPGHVVPHQLVIASVIALGIMTAVAVVLGWLLAGRMLRPLRKMTAATRRISADSLDERLGMPGPSDELKDLADTIDGLLERLEGAFAAQRRFAANASHELRTPLTTMRAWLDVAVAKPEPVPPQTIALAGRLRTELDRVDGLLEGFLVLARAQHGALPGRGVFTLDDIASAALAARADGIAARHLTVRQVTGSDAAWVEGSQPLLSRMVENVLENAITHNTVGGWIHVATGADGPAARIVVETGGEVLDQRQVAELAQPFRRLGADRIGSDKGAGLGLSIVAAIASAHGGTLGLQARAEGGLRVSIGLPLAIRHSPRPLPEGAPA